jgi:uncharacterized membrane protein YbaN (DUF454 family)
MQRHVELRDDGSARRGLAASRAGRLLCLAGAVTCLGLGIAGTLLPGLPATPFLLLTGYLSARSSPRLHGMLLRSRWCGPILHDWQQHGGVDRRVKVRAVVVVGLTMTVTYCCAPFARPLLAAILVLAAIGIFAILRLPDVQKPPAP